MVNNSFTGAMAASGGIAPNLRLVPKFLRLDLTTKAYRDSYVVLHYTQKTDLTVKMTNLMSSYQQIEHTALQGEF